MTLPTCLIEAQQVAAEAEHQVHVGTEVSMRKPAVVRRYIFVPMALSCRSIGDHVRTAVFLLLLCD